LKNLLVIAYYFPPSGGPGVQRVLKHIKYLREFGWNPIVLTVSNGDFPARDESLLKQIPENIKVIRTHIFEPYDLYRMLTGKSKDTAIDVNVIKKDGQKSGFVESIAEFIRATFFIPDARIGWYFTARKAIDELMQNTDISAVYSSSPPYTCSIIARYVHRKYNLPWIAGFRDPWTGFISSPKRWFLPRFIDKSMEKSTFTESNAVECAWEGIIKDALFKYPKLDKNKFHHVPNGFDSSDFPKVEQSPNSKFTLTYTGSMYGRRNPAALFQAVENLITDNQVDKDKISFRFIGRFGNEVLEMFKNATFSKNIEVISYMAHNESIGNLMISDTLLLVVDESKESEEIVPGKVYEYIGVMKPIIAVGPENGAVGRLIKSTNSGRIAHQSNLKKISEIYIDYYTKWLNSEKFYEPDFNEIKKYERKNAAENLAKLLDTYTK
jgi:hypothetical protein